MSAKSALLMNSLRIALTPAFATLRRLGELSVRVAPEGTVYGAMTAAPGITGGVNPAGIVKFTGELDAFKPLSAAPSDPEPVMMAPLKLPSMDSELPIAMMICGCAGIVMVSGTCDTGTAGAVARAPSGQPTSNSSPAGASRQAARRRRRFTADSFIIGS